MLIVAIDNYKRHGINHDIIQIPFDFVMIYFCHKDYHTIDRNITISTRINISIQQAANSQKYRMLTRLCPTRLRTSISTSCQS